MHFRTSYEMWNEKPGITFTDPSRTKQDFKDECDINFILKRYEATGVIDHVSAFQPVYADLSAYGDVDLASAYDIVKRADEAFMALPSALRVELDHNPANLVKFISDPANKERCIEYGIFNKPVDQNSEARVVNVSNSVAGNGNS